MTRLPEAWADLEGPCWPCEGLGASSWGPGELLGSPCAGAVGIKLCQTHSTEAVGL